MTGSGATDLRFTLTPGEETWTVVGPAPDGSPHVVPSPLANGDLLRRVRELRDSSSMRFSPDQQYDIRVYQDLARELSARITPLLLSEAARKALRTRLNQVQLGRARLTIRVVDHGPLGDQVLALPWEVVAPDPGELPVRQSTLEIVRESVVPGAPELPEPSLPLAVAVAVAAPEDQPALSHEREEVRLQTLLAPLGHAVAFSDLGTLADLEELVEMHRATAILFSGHGLPGELLFEDRLGFAHPVAVDEVVRRLRAVLLDPGRPGSFPGLFFLSSCKGATSEDGPATAAALHRAGFPQVIGYFGSVRDSAASRAEQTFFQALARGDTALQAAHRARASLVDAFEHEGELCVFPLAWTQFAIYHRGVDRPVAALGRRPGRSLPPRFRRRLDGRREIPVLSQGFVGRRALQHEILRKVDAGERLIVLHGLGGSGKTALAGHLMARRLAADRTDLSATLMLRVPRPEEEGDPIRALRRQAEEHGRRHALPDWATRVAGLRGRYPVPAAGFAAALRALHELLPRLAIYLDRLDALQTGPGEGEMLGAWQPGVERWWRELVAIAEDGVLVLASTRWAGAGLPIRSYVGLPPLSASDALRMMVFFVELADLTPEERHRLTAWSEGHPRTIELLDRAVAAQRDGHGLGYEAGNPWQELVEPALLDVAEAVRRELGLRELWAGLSEGAREQARRIASSEKAMSQASVDRLGPHRDELIRCGLLIRHLEEVGGSGALRWTERWGLPLRLREVLDLL